MILKLILKTFKPHPKQKIVLSDPSRFKVIICGRRFGKTTMAVGEMIRRCGKPNQCIWYVAPTYKQAKMIAWRLLLKMVPRALVKKINETDLNVTFHNGSYIELKGADTQADTLRGVKIDFIIMDEYAFMKPSIYEEVIRQTLIDTKGGAWFVGTPKGYNHFYEMYKNVMAKKEGYEEFTAYRFISYDNPYLDKEEIDKAKKELSPETFGQEYMAEFKKHAGLVYLEFNRNTHILPIQTAKQEWDCYRTIDFGQTNPTAVLFIGADKEDNIYIFDEIYQSNLSTQELAHLIKAKNPSNYFIRTFGDSAAAQSIKDLSDIYQVPVIPVKKNTGARMDDYVMSGIEKVKGKLKIQEGTGKPKLYVASHCQNTIMEFESYSYPERREDDDIRNPKEKPEDAYNHAMDALRYFIQSYVPQSELDEEMPEYKPSGKYGTY